MIGVDLQGKYTTGTKLTGKKQLPVLELPAAQMMPESGEIICWVEQQTRPLAQRSGRGDIASFLEPQGQFKQVATSLVYTTEVPARTHNNQVDAVGEY